MPATESTTRTASKTKLHASKIDIPESKRAKLVELLNARMADTADLASQAKQAHWNVKGLEFQQLHELFDGVADAVQPFVDVLAERVTTLGGTAMGTVRMAANGTCLTEYPANITSGKDHLTAVRDRVAKYAGLIREAISAASDLDEPTTEDLFTEISRAVDLQLYFLESHLQG